MIKLFRNTDSMMFETITVLMIVFKFSMTTIAKADDTDFYFEDLSVLRNNYSAFSKAKKPGNSITVESSYTDFEPVYHVSNVLLDVLSLRKESNFKKNKIECYTVQVYSGGSRLVAFSILEKLTDVFHDGYVQYIDSNYIVRVGKFINKLELCDKYVQILKLFPNIIVRSVSVYREDVFSKNQDCLNIPIDDIAHN